MTSYRLNLKVPFQLDLHAALDKTETRMNINQEFKTKMAKPGIILDFICYPLQIFYLLPSTNEISKVMYPDVSVCHYTGGKRSLYKVLAPPPHVQGPGSDLVPGMFKHVNYVVCTVGKRAVGIRLKCLLVLFTNIFLVT